MNLRAPSELTDAELETEIRALAILDSPLSLAYELDKKYAIRNHLRLVSNAFTKLALIPDTRLLITMPPRAGKSELAGVWGPLWWLANHPTHRIVTASYASSLAERAGKKVRGLIEVFGPRIGLKIAQGSAGARDWYLSTRGGIKSVGVGSGLTGHDADLLIVDDPHKDRAEANSLRMRDNVYEWWQSTALSRLSPGAATVLILTRWHPDDLAGRVLKEDGLTSEGGSWTHIHIPAICDNPDTDPLGRQVGEYMQHPKIAENDTEALATYWNRKRKEAGTRDWHALYQGNPQPAEGALVTTELLRDIRNYNPTAKPIKKAVAVDPSGGGRDTAGIGAGYLGDDKKLYITHDRTLTGPADEWSRTACILAAETDADKIVVESNFGGDMARMVIKTAWETLKRENPTDPKYSRIAPMIEMVHAKRGKLLRAEPIAQQMHEGNIFLTSYMPELEQEWCVSGGQSVATRRGDINIENVKVGDQVMTRKGWRKVLKAGLVGYKKTLTLTMSDGRTLRCTDDHQIYVIGRGWTPALEAEINDRIPIWQNGESKFYTKGSGILWLQMVTGNGTKWETSHRSTGLCTVPSGLKTMDLYQTDLMSLTSMEIGAITIPETCKLGAENGAPSTRGKTQLGSSKNSREPTTTKDKTDTLSADEVELKSRANTSYIGLFGKPTMEKFLMDFTYTTKTETGQTTRSKTLSACHSVITSAESTEIAQRDTFCYQPKRDQISKNAPGETRSQGQSNALNAETYFNQQDNVQDFAEFHAANVSTITSNEIAEPVYDLTIEGEPEYFVNGLLVHNCTWQPTDPDSPGRIDWSVHLAYALIPVPGSEIVISSPARKSRSQINGQPAIFGRR